MSNVTVQARVSHELKQEAETVFSAIGMTTAEAIRVFLQQTVNSGGLPFQPTAKRPNIETLAAMIELDKADSHKPVLIPGKQTNAVLVSETDWRAIEETLYLLSIPGMRDSIIEGLTTPVAETFDEVEW